VLRAIPERERLQNEWLALLAAARRLAVPVACSEHCPESLGSAFAPLRQQLQENEILRKRTFSCLATEGARARLLMLGTRHVVLCGVETHVCVMQTAFDLLANGQQVFVVTSAVASRRHEDTTVALDRMARAGAHIVTFEMVLFEWLRGADHPAFRDGLAIIKDRDRTRSASAPGDPI
jgi:nicotinamidase-related amidase